MYAPYLTIPCLRIDLLLTLPRVTIERIGLLNEKCFAYHEDEETGIWAKKARIRSLLVPESKDYHKNSRSTGGFFSPIQAFLRSRNLFFLWMDGLGGWDRVLHVRRYLAQVISYGSTLKGENLLSGDFRAIASNMRRRIGMKQQASGKP